jgi:hypothetical protein
MSASELELRRVHDCRLRPERALESLHEAEAFLRDRGLLTLLPDCALPSLFAACHEEPYLAGKGGFADYPRTKYVWAFELRERPGCHWLRLRRGKGVLATGEAAALADPLCREELDRAEQGARGEDARRLVAHLAAAGPSLLDEVKEELGLDSRRLRAARTALERVGAVVSVGATVPARSGGHLHTSELQRWDQRFPAPPPGPGGLGELVVAGVRAAVIAPEREARRWFSWPLAAAAVDGLVEAGRLVRVDGFLAAA